MNFKKFLTTLAIGVLAIIMNFGFNKSNLAFIIVAIAGGVVTFSMLMEMIRTLKSGKYGVDILMEMKNQNVFKSNVAFAIIIRKRMFLVL